MSGGKAGPFYFESPGSFPLDRLGTLNRIDAVAEAILGRLFYVCGSMTTVSTRTRPCTKKL